MGHCPSGSDLLFGYFSQIQPMDFRTERKRTGTDIGTVTETGSQIAEPRLFWLAVHTSVRAEQVFNWSSAMGRTHRLLIGVFREGRAAGSPADWLKWRANGNAVAPLLKTLPARPEPAGLQAPSLAPISFSGAAPKVLAGPGEWGSGARNGQRLCRHQREAPNSGRGPG